MRREIIVVVLLAIAFVVEAIISIPEWHGASSRLAVGPTDVPTTVAVAANTVAPTAVPTEPPTASPIPIVPPTPKATAVPTPAASPTPTPTPTLAPSPSPNPTLAPTPKPTAKPTPTPTAKPIPRAIRTAIDDAPGAGFVYAGAWQHVADAKDGRSNGTSSRSFRAGSEATLTFEGTGISLYGIRGPKGGRATITIDGRQLGSAAFFAPEKETGALLFTAPRLKPGPHRLSISVDAPTTPSRRYVNLDGVVVEK